MQEARDVIEALVARGEVVYGVTTGFGDLATTFIPPGDAGGAAGEPDRVPRRRRRAAVPARGRARDAAAAGEHARARPLGLPAAARRPDLRAPRARDPPGRAGAGERGRVGRPRPARAPRAAADRSRRGRGRRPAGRAGARRAPRRRPGAADARAQGGPRAAQRHAADERARRAARRRRRPARCARPRSRRRCRSRRCSGPRSPSRRRTSSPARTRGRSRSPRELRHLLRGSGLQQAHHGSAHKVQDPYSLRCVPQVHGAVRDALDHLRRVLDIELNSATDNPLVFPARRRRSPVDALATGGGLVISGGNFHGEPIALALDFAKLALAELGSISRAADGAARRRPPQRRPAGVPVAGPGPEQRADDRPVHGGGPRVGEQGARPPVVAPTRSRRARTRRTTCRWAPTAARHARTVLGHVEQIVGDRAAVRGPGARPAARAAARRDGAGARCPATASPRRTRRVRERVTPPRAATASPGRTSPRRSRWSTTARWSTSPAEAAGGSRRLAAMAIRIVDVTDDATFALLPPCADPGFDHRSCDYWEDADRGSKAARASWLRAAADPAAGGRAQPAAQPVRRRRGRRAGVQPVRAAAPKAAFNPFATTTTSRPSTRSRRGAEARPGASRRDAPPKLRLLGPRARRCSGRTRRSCSTTTSPRCTRSSGRCPPTRARCGRASCTRACRTRRCPR